ncbi:hypothetical protein H0O00_05065 [Candidatus Micrarchaeota archaeon]|nr:hypothetical protein [Candidatus Micrarchaeota archaeon]
MMRMEKARPATTIMHAGSRFGRYKGITESPVRDIGVNDAVLRQMEDAWKRLDPWGMTVENYQETCELVKRVDCTAKDVETFTIGLAGHQEENDFSDKAGMFLSALMNSGKDSRYVIHTAHLQEMISSLGYRNTKDIEIDGDLGSYTGDEMESGTITVHGNVEDCLGFCMRGGRIFVERNADDEAGRGMEGGEIIIAGSVGDNLGGGMENGRIIVEGDAYGSVGTSMKGGEVVVKGSVYGNAGEEMEAGKIVIEGDVIDIGNTGKHMGKPRVQRVKVGAGIGMGMAGGEIWLDGRFHHLSHMIEHGKIYHKGKLILEK